MSICFKPADEIFFSSIDVFELHLNDAYCSSRRIRIDRNLLQQSITLPMLLPAGKACQWRVLKLRQIKSAHIRRKIWQGFSFRRCHAETTEFILFNGIDRVWDDINGSNYGLYEKRDWYVFGPGIQEVGDADKHESFRVLVHRSGARLHSYRSVTLTNESREYLELTKNYTVPFVLIIRDIHSLDRASVFLIKTFGWKFLQPFELKNYSWNPEPNFGNVKNVFHQCFACRDVK